MKRTWTRRQTFEWFFIIIGVAGIVSVGNAYKLHLEAQPYLNAPPCNEEAIAKNDSENCRLLVGGVVESVNDTDRDGNPRKWSGEAHLRVPVRGESLSRLYYFDMKDVGAFKVGGAKKVEMFRNVPVAVETNGEMKVTFSHPMNAKRSQLKAALMSVAVGVIGLALRLVRRRKEKSAPPGWA